MANIYRAALNDLTESASPDQTWAAHATDEEGFFSRNLELDFREKRDAAGDAIRLGEGTYAQTYLVEERAGLRLDFAAKLLKSPVPSHAQRFAEEAAILHSLRDRRIVLFHAIGTFRGRPTLVMQIAPGVPLDKWLSSGSDGSPPSRRTVLDIFLDLVCALEKAHRQNVAHGDISPRNILVDRDEVRIVDFGLATIDDNEANFARVGTPGFCAPASVSDNLLRDIIAVGKVLGYALLAVSRQGTLDLTDPPFDAWSSLKLSGEYLGGNSSTSLHKCGCDHRLIGIVRSAIHCPGNTRWNYSSMEQFRMDLASYMRGGSTSQYHLVPREKVARLWRTPMARLVVGTLVVALLAATIVVANSITGRKRDAAEFVEVIDKTGRNRDGLTAINVLEDTAHGMSNLSFNSEVLQFVSSSDGWSLAIGDKDRDITSRYVEKMEQDFQESKTKDQQLPYYPALASERLCSLSARVLSEGEMHTSLDLLRRAAEYLPRIDFTRALSADEDAAMADIYEVRYRPFEYQLMVVTQAYILAALAELVGNCDVAREADLVASSSLSSIDYSDPLFRLVLVAHAYNDEAGLRESFVRFRRKLRSLSDAVSEGFIGKWETFTATEKESYLIDATPIRQRLLPARIRWTLIECAVSLGRHGKDAAHREIGLQIALQQLREASRDGFCEIDNLALIDEEFGQMLAMPDVRKFLEGGLGFGERRCTTAELRNLLFNSDTASPDD